MTRRENVRGAAAAGLAAMGTEAAARRIVEAVMSGRLEVTLAGALLGRMRGGHVEVVAELLASDDPARWRLGAETAVASWRDDPDSAALSRWRAPAAALLGREPGPTGVLGRWMSAWLAPGD